MKIDIRDIKFWMDAIRDSEDRYRTLESFWEGQLKSKIWLIESLLRVNKHANPSIAIHGGWNGVLASLIFNSEIDPIHVTSIDIDPSCKETANTINKRQQMEGKFTAVTADMTEYRTTADIIINTSCEHITQEQYNKWLDLQPTHSLFVLQGNNYYDLDEHIRCAKEENEFSEQSRLDPIWKGAMELPKYTRFMIIGKKNV